MKIQQSPANFKGQNIYLYDLMEVLVTTFFIQQSSVSLIISVENVLWGYFMAKYNFLEMGSTESVVTSNDIV